MRTCEQDLRIAIREEKRLPQNQTIVLDARRNTNDADSRHGILQLVTLCTHGAPRQALQSICSCFVRRG